MNTTVRPNIVDTAANNDAPAVDPSTKQTLDLLSGGGASDDDLITSMMSNADDDTVYGGAGDDTVSSNDTVAGGNDTVSSDDSRNNDVTDEDDNLEGDDSLKGDDQPDEEDALFDDMLDDGSGHERDEENSDDEPIDASKLGDDLMVAVTVDGEDREVSLGDLKRRYAGEAAIEGRLQEATEYRKGVSETFERTKTAAEAILQKFGEKLFARSVERPDEALRASDPQAFLLAADAYNREGEAIQGYIGELDKMIKELDAAAQEARDAERVQAAQELRRLMPVFADKDKAPKVKKVLLDTAMYFGYTEAEIAEAVDPRQFRVMAFAAEALRARQNTKATPGKPSGKSIRKRGTRNVSGGKRTAARSNKAAVERAQKTGRVEDVAATMFTGGNT